MPIRHVLSDPGGRRYVLAAGPADTPVVNAVSGTVVSERWEITVRGEGAEDMVFEADCREVAERLIMLLGEEIELGVLGVR